jgi:hypothetical protein
VETSRYDETYDLTKSNEFLRFSYKTDNNPLKQNIHSNNEKEKHIINSDSKRESKSQNKIITNLKRKDYNNNRYKTNRVLSNENLNEESFFEQKYVKYNLDLIVIRLKEANSVKRQILEQMSIK